MISPCSHKKRIPLTWLTTLADPQCTECTILKARTSPSSRRNQRSFSVLPFQTAPSTTPLLPDELISPPINLSRKHSDYDDETILILAAGLSSHDVNSAIRSIRLLHIMVTAVLLKNQQSRTKRPGAFFWSLINCDVMGKLIHLVVHQGDHTNRVAQLMAASLFDLIGVNVSELIEDDTHTRSLFSRLLKSNLDTAILAVRVLFKLRYSYPTDDWNLKKLTSLMALRNYQRPSSVAAGRNNGHPQFRRLIQFVHLAGHSDDLFDGADMACEFNSRKVREKILYSSEIFNCLRQLLLKNDLSDQLQMQVVLLLDSDCEETIATACDLGIVSLLKNLALNDKIGFCAYAVLRRYFRYCKSINVSYFEELGLLDWFF